MLLVLHIVVLLQIQVKQGVSKQDVYFHDFKHNPLDIHRLNTLKSTNEFYGGSLLPRSFKLNLYDFMQDPYYFSSFKNQLIHIIDSWEANWSFKSYKIIQILRLILKDLGWLWLIQGCTQLFLSEKRILDL